MKSEPNVYSITDLERDRTTVWDGVRNYQARNFLRSMEIGDLAFFYHSNAEPPGIAGLMKIVEPDIVDPSQFDPKSKYYDEKSPQDNPRWRTVGVEFVAVFSKLIPLEMLRQSFSADELIVVKQGNRLSVTPVSEPVAQKILAMGNRDDR